MNKKHIRDNFRYQVYYRDQWRCQICKLRFKEGDLDAHHITDRKEMPNGGYVLSNGITLCKECHKKAEIWHWSKHTEHFAGMHPNDLYHLINSSKEQAIEDSENLTKPR